MNGITFENALVPRGTSSHCAAVSSWKNDWTEHYIEEDITSFQSIRVNAYEDKDRDRFEEIFDTN